MYQIEYPKQLKKVEIMLPEELVSKIEDLVAYHQEAYPKAALDMSIILEKVVEEALAISPTLEQWRNTKRPSGARPKAKERRGPKSKAARAAEASNKAAPLNSPTEAAPAPTATKSAPQPAQTPAVATAGSSVSSPSVQASGVHTSKNTASAQAASSAMPVAHDKITAEMEKRKASVQAASEVPSTSGT